MASRLNDWENPTVYGINKLKPHVPLSSYEDMNQVFRYFSSLQDGSTSGRRCILDCDHSWKFLLCKSPESISESFYLPEYDDSSWTSVRS